MTPHPSSCMDGNDIAAEFILDTTWEALPASVQRRAKMCLLDDLGAVLGGTLTRISHITAAYAAERMPGDEATILWITGYVLDDKRINQLVRMVWEFDSVSSVKELTQLLQ